MTEQLLSERIGIKEVKVLAKEQPVEMLWQLVLGDDSLKGRNAAWVLTHKPLSEICQLPYQQMIDLAIATPSVPIRRLTLCLIERIPMDPEQLRTDFLDFCLQHMIMLEEPSGVQALCMKLAQRMCAYYPELEHEFYETLRMAHKEFFKPGVTHLIKKYLAKSPNKQS